MLGRYEENACIPITDQGGSRDNRIVQVEGLIGQDLVLLHVQADVHLVPSVVYRVGLAFFIFHGVGPDQDHFSAILTNPLGR